MEQRALFTSVLVLGCVTAAGAGSFLAMRQTPVVPAAELTATQADSSLGDPVEDGTVADIEVPSSPETSEPADNRGPVSTTAQRASAPAASSVSGSARDAARVEPAAPTRQVPSTASPVSAARPPGHAPVATPAPSRSTAGNGDTWPARDSASAARENPAEPDAAVVSTTGGDSLPSRSGVDDVSTPPAAVRRLETMTIPADAVIGVQLESSVSSLNARVEETVKARVTRDLVSGGQVVVPVGARLVGNVTLVEEGGRVRERARLGIRFHTLVLVDGTEVRLPTETIYRDGDSPAGRSAAKIGGATVGGAILGAIMGGGKGAVIGAATGAGSGTGWAMAGERRPAELRAGQSLTVRVSDSVSTQVER